MSLKATKERIIKVLLVRKDFQNDILILRKKWDIDIKNQGPIVNRWNPHWGKKCRYVCLRQGMKPEDITIVLLMSAMKRDINKFLVYFQLDQYFYDFVFIYLTTGEVVIGNTDLVLELDPNNPEAGLKINASTFADRDDVKKAHNFTQIFFPHLTAQVKAPIASLHQDRNLRIIEMKQQGQKSKAIANQLNSELKLKLTATDIDKIYSRLKAELNLPPK